jgi:hypothetical protein
MERQRKRARTLKAELHPLIALSFDVVDGKVLLAYQKIS